ncbi:RICIN domain-containing protein [Streptomyces sp. NPDC085932]|uniref:RICIN domain-containing protein n=1 Tax=Streptomyces sp. NPDC085932 TaxID=3365741 RepID=UPI0037CEF91E
MSTDTKGIFMLPDLQSQSISSTMKRKDNTRRRCSARGIRLTSLTSAVIVTLGAVYTVETGSAAASPATAHPIQSGMKGLSQNMVIDVPGGVAAWGVQLVLWTAHGGGNQDWELKPVTTKFRGLGNGTSTAIQGYKIVNPSNGLCMEAGGAHPRVGAPVQQYGCDPNGENQPNQIWYDFDDLKGHHFLVNGISFETDHKGTKMLFDDGGRLVVGTLHAGAIMDPRPALVLEVSGVTNGSRLTLQEGRTFGKTQIWKSSPLRELLDHFRRETPGSDSGDSGNSSEPGCFKYYCLIR